MDGIPAAGTEADPDITIEEIWEKLNPSASYSAVERAINMMGYTLKKRDSLFPIIVNIFDTYYSTHKFFLNILLKVEMYS